MSVRCVFLSNLVPGRPRNVTQMCNCGIPCRRHVAIGCCCCDPCFWTTVHRFSYIYEYSPTPELQKTCTKPIQNSFGSPLCKSTAPNYIWERKLQNKCLQLMLEWTTGLLTLLPIFARVPPAGHQFPRNRWISVKPKKYQKVIRKLTTGERGKPIWWQCLQPNWWPGGAKWRKCVPLLTHDAKKEPCGL
jgi:hypothetical protein